MGEKATAKAPEDAKGFYAPNVRPTPSWRPWLFRRFILSGRRNETKVATLSIPAGQLRAQLFLREP